MDRARHPPAILANEPTVLELKDISLTIGPSDAEQNLLSEITLRLPARHFAAILGPSGCGKSTLLKVIAGIKEHTLGTIFWDGRDLEAGEDMDPHEIGYVPQFSIAYELLTVEECVGGALRLRVAGVHGEELDERITKVLKGVGIEEIADRRVSLLSGGQKRRLALAMEMVSSPNLLLCDEVTSGLDPKSEDEIVKLMHEISRRDQRLVLSVTHSLQHVALYDSVIVLHQGVLAYHGSPEFITHYFDIKRAEDLYPRLTERKAADWQRSWQKHLAAYYQQSGLPAVGSPMTKADATVEDAGEAKAADAPDLAKAEPAPALSEEEELERLRAIVEGKAAKKEVEKLGSGAKAAKDSDAKADKSDASAPHVATELPSIFSQFLVLLARRWKLFFRDRGQLILQAALLFGFPCLVVIFALDGLPQVKGLADSSIGNVLTNVQQQLATEKQNANTGSLVSGLIMFQVILLALMGSNNAAREIAAERHLLEKEKFAGLSPLAYLGSKLFYLGALVLAQSIWMAAFVNMIVGFQGSFFDQVLNLVLVNAAMTSICLGISAWTKTAEQSSLLSIYLVGFQLPLSGAVLALPKAIAGITQIFIASYWGWSGFIRSMENTRHWDAVTKVTQTEPAAGTLCLLILTAHVIFGLLLAYSGSKNSRWE
jgi:ABC-type multidrug transport system ATPase subunit